MNYSRRPRMYLALFLLIILFTCTVIGNDLYHVSHPRKELQIDEFATIFQQVSQQIKSQKEIFFYTNVPDLDGSALYFQSQFVLSPTILSINNNHQKLSLFVIDPKLPVNYSQDAYIQDTLLVKHTSAVTILLIQQKP